MRKVILAFILVALIVSLSINAFAATGINANEQEVLDLLSSSIVLGVNDWKFEIPQKYINTAKNYFTGNCDMSDAEKEAILAYINAGIEVIKNDAAAQNASGTTFSLDKMSAEARSTVLSIGKSACEEVDLQLTYNSAENAVIITDKTSSTPVFESTAIIKTTGEPLTMDAAFVGIAVLVCLTAISFVMLGVSKKFGLWVK